MSFKFDNDGVVKPFRGNTVILPIPQNTEFFNRLLDFYRYARRLSFHDKITLLPPSSYHVTLMNCSHEHDHSRGHWPTSVPSSATIERCSEYLGEVFGAHEFEFESPFQMKVIEDIGTLEKPRSINVIVMPSDTAQDSNIRNLREQISKTTGLQDASHASNRFHITLAYINQELDGVETQELQQEISKLHAVMTEKCPTILFNVPEFATFEDMYYFHQVCQLKQR